MSATLLAPPPVRPRSPLLLTAADVALLPRTLACGDVRYELDDGELIVMPLPGELHADVQKRVLYYLTDIAELKLGLGESRGEAGVILRRHPDRVVGPDACFILSTSLPARRTKEGFLEVPPELVVEVESKNDTDPRLRAKSEEYFEAGVRMVWRLDPERRTATVHRPGRPDESFGPEQALVVEDLLPAFSVPVARLFPAVPVPPPAG